MLDGAVGLPLTALDVLADAAVLAAARAELEAAGGVLDLAEFLGWFRPRAAGRSGGPGRAAGGGR